MKYKAIVSGFIYLDEDGDKDIEVFTQVDNDDEGTEIFCDIDHALIENIETNDGEDNYFIAVVESTFTSSENLEGTDYDIEHDVKEITSISDLME